MTNPLTDEEVDGLIQSLGLRDLFDKAIKERLYFVWGGDTAICFFPSELLYQLRQGRFRHGARTWTLADPNAEIAGYDRRIASLEEEKVKLRGRQDKELAFVFPSR